MHNIYTHNGTVITQDDAVDLIGGLLVDALLNENKKQLSNGWDIYNSEFRISHANRLNIRSSFDAALLDD